MSAKRTSIQPARRAGKPASSLVLALYRRRWIALATLTGGSLMQFAGCREDVALFGLRTAVSSITLPIDTFIRNFIFSFAGII